MKNLKLFTLLLSFAFLVFQCKDDDEPQQPPDPYEGCCGTVPVEFMVGEAKLYIPMPTANADGVNDVFFY